MQVWNKALQGLKEFEDLAEAVNIGRCPVAAGPSCSRRTLQRHCPGLPEGNSVLCADDLEARTSFAVLLGEDAYPVLERIHLPLN